MMARLHPSLAPWFRSFESETWATFVPAPGEDAAALYDRVARFVVDRGLQLFHERCTARTSALSAMAEVRAEAYGRHGIDGRGALALIGQAPCGPGELTGVQLWLTARDVELVVQAGAVVGRRALGLVSMPAVGPAAEAVDTPEELASTLRSATARLDGAGLSWHDVARTWITAPRLLDIYPALNDARRDAFHAAGIARRGERAVWLPASTGIAGGNAAGWACAFDLLAAPGLPARRVASTVQCEAPDYGSLFARAVALQAGGVDHTLVSGTASIGAAGETLSPGDPTAQADRTLASVRNLLTACGQDFGDVVQAALYVKHPSSAAVFAARAAEAGLDAALIVAGVADVCRPDLLLELEVIAAKAR